MPSMIVRKKLVPALKKVMLSATAVFALMQCSEEEMIAPAAATTSNEISAASVASLTVTGSNTIFATVPDCKTCTYVVDANAETIDGLELGFKPGSILCLNKGIAYKNLEFVNLEGTTQNPIVIATVGDAPVAAASEGSETDPY